MHVVQVLSFYLFEVGMRKLILKNNIFGIDLNPNAVEIAKLRLWMWLASVYEEKNVAALPNIEYNLRVGNCLFGFIDISKFKNQKIGIAEYFSENESLLVLLKSRENLISFYKSATGEKAKKLKDKIESRDIKIRKMLDMELHDEFAKKGIILKNDKFVKLKPFHWGFEFYGIFNKSDSKEKTGFDIIIGNPPYGNLLNQDEKKLCKKYFTCLKANNIAENFFERSFMLLKNNGILGYVTPKTIAFYSSWKEIRKLILNKTITHIYDVGLGFVGVNYEEIVLIIEKKESIQHDTLVFVAKNLKSSTKDKSPLFEGKIALEDMRKHNIILFRTLSKIEKEIVNYIDSTCIKFKHVYKSAFRGLYIPDEEKKNLKEGNIKWINKVPDVKRFYIKQVMKIELHEEKWREKAKQILQPRLFFKVLRGKRLVCYPDLKGEYLTTEKLVNAVIDLSEDHLLETISLIINSYVPSFYIQKMLFSETTETSRVMDGIYLGEIPIPRLSIDKKTFTILCNYLLFMNSDEKIRKSMKEIIEYFDHQIVDFLVFELYFKDKIHSKLFDKITELLIDVSKISDKQVKINNIIKVYESLKRNEDIVKEIEKLKNHFWVKRILLRMS